MNSKRRKEKLGIAGRGPGLLGRKQLSQHHRWSIVVTIIDQINHNISRSDPTLMLS